MNKIFKYIAVGAIGLSLGSCLELSPKDQLADPNLWEQPGDFETFANKFYDWLPNYGMIYSDYVHCDKHSDLLIDKNSKDLISNGTNTIPQSDGDYTGAYSRIRRCNLLITNAGKYPGNPSDLRQSLGEAYFFRAYNYFQLVQKFGDVIIVDQVIDTDDPRMNAPRDERTKVVDFIVEDLRKAAELLKSTSDIAEGRVGSEGANAYLSRVALFEGTWQKFRNNESKGKEYLDIAADAAKKVIDSNKFSLFYNATLGDASQKYMFILENDKSNGAGLTKSDNKEYIIKRCFDPVLRKGGRNVTTEVFFNAQWVSSKLADMYLCQNGLPIEYNGTVNPQFGGREKIDSEWQNRDNRMRYTLCRPHDNFWNNVKSRIDWSNSEAEINAAARKNNIPAGGTGYFPQKWAVERKCTDQDESFDWPVLRYAEVLLNYAEAVYERDGEISDADLNISLNLTRRRVNKSMPALSNALVSTNGLDMREEIRRERTIELFQEGFRLDDLRRWKTAEKEMPKDFTGIVWTGEWLTSWPNTGYPLNNEGRVVIETGRVWAEKNYLFPIPTDQLQLNPNLGQNTGW